MYIPLAGGGGGVLLEILRGGVSPGSSNPDPSFRPKKCNFQTRPLKSISLLTVFRPGRKAECYRYFRA